jgi:hypothetical protein
MADITLRRFVAGSRRRPPYQHRSGVSRWACPLPPIGDLSRCSKKCVHKLDLFDDLVGADEQSGRHGKAETPGGLEIEEQLNPRGLLYR